MVQFVGPETDIMGKRIYIPDHRGYTCYHGQHQAPASHQSAGQPASQNRALNTIIKLSLVAAIQSSH